MVLVRSGPIKWVPGRSLPGGIAVGAWS